MSKGKGQTASWARLPQEIFRVLATHVVENNSTVVPRSWAHQQHDESRAVLEMYLGARAMIILSRVCRNWERHVTKDNKFWMHAVEALDPEHSHPLFDQGAMPRDMAFYHQWMEINRTACAICRVNCAYDPSVGLYTQVRRESCLALGTLNVCKEHDLEDYCGVCLKDEASQIPGYEDGLRDPNIARNDDERTFPGVVATCECCRRDAIWNQTLRVYRRDMITYLYRQDYFIRSLWLTFEQRGEGELRNLIYSMDERVWLNQNTNFAESLHGAQTQIKARRRSFSPSDEVVEDQLASWDPAMVHSVRHLSLGEWARKRILEGCWVSPWDMLQNDYRHFAENLLQAMRNGGQPRHPFSSEVDSLRAAPTTPLYHWTNNPPPHALFGAGQNMFEVQLRLILMPALQNCLLRLGAECHVTGQDILKAAANISSIQLLSPKFLHAAEVWVNGFDWIERCNLILEEELRSVHALSSPVARSNDEMRPPNSDGSSGSDHSDHSDERPSPTTTVRTTPSPSPQLRAKSFTPSGDDTPTAPSVTRLPPPSTPPLVASSTPSQSRLASSSPSPQKPTPTVLEAVPRIPLLPSHVSTNVHVLIDQIWRETIAPLYECQCSICRRSAGFMERMANRAAAGIHVSPAAANAAPAIGTHPLTVQLTSQDVYGVGADDAEVDEYYDDEDEEFYSDDMVEDSDEWDVDVPGQLQYNAAVREGRVKSIAIAPREVVIQTSEAQGDDRDVTMRSLSSTQSVESTVAEKAVAPAVRGGIVSPALVAGAGAADGERAPVLGERRSRERDDEDISDPTGGGHERKRQKSS